MQINYHQPQTQHLHAPMLSFDKATDRGQKNNALPAKLLTDSLRLVAQFREDGIHDEAATTWKWTQGR